MRCTCTPFLRLIVVIVLALTLCYRNTKLFFRTNDWYKTREIWYCLGSNTLFLPSAAQDVLDTCRWEQDEGDRIILYGTMKAPKRPPNITDPFDPYIIINRTLRNWAALPGVQPLILAEDEVVLQAIEAVNAEVARDQKQHGAASTYRSFINVIPFLEHNTKIKRAPTYRGLFRAAIQEYPDAYLFLYANGDILFTGDVVRAAYDVQRYYDCVVRPYNPLMHGLMMTGRRTNVTVSPWWDPWRNASAGHGGDWEEALRHLAYTEGGLFHPSGLDYFLFTRDIFDWNYDFAEIDLMVGGVNVDTMLVSSAVLMMERGEVFAVDASPVVLAMHQNEGTVSKKSGESLQSYYNLFLVRNLKALYWMYLHSFSYGIPLYLTYGPPLNGSWNRAKRYKRLEKAFVHRRSVCAWYEEPWELLSRMREEEETI